jgi:hypothetical protein
MTMFETPGFYFQKVFKKHCKQIRIWICYSNTRTLGLLHHVSLPSSTNRPRGGKWPARVFSGVQEIFRLSFFLSYSVGIEGKEKPDANFLSEPSLPLNSTSRRPKPPVIVRHPADDPPRPHLAASRQQHPTPPAPSPCSPRPPQPSQHATVHLPCSHLAARLYWTRGTNSPSRICTSVAVDRAPTLSVSCHRAAQSAQSAALFPCTSTSPDPADHARWHGIEPTSRRHLRPAPPRAVTPSPCSVWLAT